MENKDNAPENTTEQLASEAGLEQQVEEENKEEEKPSYDELVLMLEDTRAKADEHWDQLLRATSELDNLRRRTERELERVHKYALDNFAQELLPVLDSLELGLLAAKDEKADIAKLREGTELTLKMLQSVMEKYGVTIIDPLNEPFNPELHQAMSIQESEEKAPNTVLIVFQKGYLLNDRLIRPARVIVSKAPEKQGKQSGSEQNVGTNIDEQA